MLGYLVFSLAIASAFGQAPCKCGAFVTAEVGQILLLEIDPIDIGACNLDQQCSRRCSDEISAATAGGNLNHVTSDGVTVGQFLCNNAGGHVIDNQYVFSYYNLCESNWQWTGDSSLQALCCDASGTYLFCPDPGV